MPPRAAMYGKQLRKFGESLRKASVRNDRRFFCSVPWRFELDSYNIVNEDFLPIR